MQYGVGMGYAPICRKGDEEAIHDVEPQILRIWDRRVDVPAPAPSRRLHPPSRQWLPQAEGLRLWDTNCALPTEVRHARHSWVTLSLIHALLPHQKTQLSRAVQRVCPHQGRPRAHELGVPAPYIPKISPLCLSSKPYLKVTDRVATVRKPLLSRIKEDHDGMVHSHLFLTLWNPVWACVSLPFQMVSTLREDSTFYSSFCLSPTHSGVVLATPGGYSINVHCLLHWKKSLPKIDYSLLPLQKQTFLFSC